MAVSDPFGLIGTVLDNKYGIETAVAEGGFGTVYKGEQKALRRPVAIKVLKVPASLQGDMLKEFLAGFEREAMTIARLDHPAIVRVLDFGTSPVPRGGSATWMALEWVAGETLANNLAARRAAGGQVGRSPADCLALLRPVLEALTNTHDEGIAHRDLKPANLMLPQVRRDTGASTITRRSEAALRLLDFGIAKIMAPDEANTSGETSTRATVLTFTLPYASPEQVSALRTGPWTDVYALGLVLTEMLTGEAPYRGADAMGVHMDILASCRPTPAKFGYDVGSWEAVLLRATAIRPGDRYANAGELLAALEAALPTSAWSPGGAVGAASGAPHVGTGTSGTSGAPPVVTSTLPVLPPSTVPNPLQPQTPSPIASTRQLVLRAAMVGLALAATISVAGYKLLVGASEPGARPPLPSVVQDAGRLRASPPLPPQPAPALVAQPTPAVQPTPVLVQAPGPDASTPEARNGRASDHHTGRGHGSHHQGSRPTPTGAAQSVDPNQQFGVN